ncbi:Spy/CpxP family protein refolding chaperone [Alishewanella sp. WH16-1]|uniref:Spy/CpxP family protein refolding chaperone n=1 Tax=Alishewanella sp. WH16-1 TaxID=1651088 RepID=UPI00070B6738|nr:Spy/CpxP family protein refolding chaperone [Alishewanella sp. WH16-1]
MKVKTILVSITSGLLLISSLNPALAGDKGEWRQKMAGAGQHGQLWQQLDLTDQQRQQIRELMQAHRAAKPTAQREAMQALLDAPQFDEQAARDILAQRAAQREQRQLAGLKLQHEIRQLLTSEQREQLQQLQQQRHSKRHDKAGKPGRWHKQSADNN